MLRGSCRTRMTHGFWPIYQLSQSSLRLRNFVFSTKILVGNTCGVAEFCLFYEFHLTEVFSIRTWNTYRLYVDIIKSFQVERSTKASEKYSEQGRFMITFI
jgi:hypothetical protein